MAAQTTRASEYKEVYPRKRATKEGRFMKACVRNLRRAVSAALLRSVGGGGGATGAGSVGLDSRRSRVSPAAVTALRCALRDREGGVQVENTTST